LYEVGDLECQKKSRSSGASTEVPEIPPQNELEIAPPIFRVEVFLFVNSI
jgi:hypothetical protein